MVFLLRHLETLAPYCVQTKIPGMQVIPHFATRADAEAYLTDSCSALVREFYGIASVCELDLEQQA